MKAAIPKIRQLINLFPSITHLDLLLESVDTEDVRLFLEQFVLPKNANFKIALKIDMRSAQFHVPGPPLNLDALHTMRNIYPHLMRFAIWDDPIDHDANINCQGCNVILGGKTFGDIYLYGVEMDTRRSNARTLGLSVHIRGSSFQSDKNTHFIQAAAPPHHRDADIFRTFPHLGRLGLDLQHMNLENWKRLAQCIPQTVTWLTLKGRSQTNWTGDDISAHLDESEKPTIMNIEALRHVAHLPLTNLETHYMFFNAPNSTLDSSFLPSTMEDIMCHKIGQFPLSRFAEWLGGLGQNVALNFIHLNFLDRSIFSHSSVAKLVLACHDFEPEPIRLILSEFRDDRDDGSEHADTMPLD